MESTNWNEVLKSALAEPGRISAAYSAFHSYSLGNQLAAMWQLSARNMAIAPIASYKAWQDKGRQVIKGAKAIELCMPVTCKGEKESSEGGKEAFTFSRFIWKKNWFSLDQTEGADYIHEVKTPTWNKAAALIALDITECTFELVDGNCQGYAKARQIAVNPLALMPWKTTFHEFAHVVLGHTVEQTMADSAITPKDIRELEAEGVAFLLCSLLGLPGVEEARGYMQSWYKGAAIPEKSAQRIMGTADKILKAGAIAA